MWWVLINITSTITKLSPIWYCMLKIWNSSIDFTATHTSSYILCMIARYLVCLKMPFKNCTTILSPAMLKMCVVTRFVSETNLKMVNFCKLGYYLRPSVFSNFINSLTKTNTRITDRYFLWMFFQPSFILKTWHQWTHIASLFPPVNNADSTIQIHFLEICHLIKSHHNTPLLHVGPIHCSIIFQGRCPQRQNLDRENKNNTNNNCNKVTN